MNVKILFVAAIAFVNSIVLNASDQIASASAGGNSIYGIIWLAPDCHHNTYPAAYAIVGVYECNRLVGHTTCDAYGRYCVENLCAGQLLAVGAMTQCGSESGAAGMVEFCGSGHADRLDVQLHY